MESLKTQALKEGNETVTNCKQLKMPASDGKMRLTDVADTEELFRLIQSWAKISDYERAVHVQVPQGPRSFPVYMALHGRGGTGARKLMKVK